MPSIREKEIKKVSEEIMELLSKPTVKEKSLAEKFRSKGGKKINIPTTISKVYRSNLFSYCRNTRYGILPTWHSIRLYGGTCL